MARARRARGALIAPLPSDQIARIDRVALVGDAVQVDLVVTPPPSRTQRPQVVRFSLATLRARLAAADGAAQLAKHRWRAADAAFTRAIDLDPSLDAPYVDRAAARLALHDRAGAAASIAPVAARDPAWLTWRAFADPALAALRTDPALRALAAPAKGTFDPVPLYRCAGDCLGVAVEPTGRFLAAFAAWQALPGTPLAAGALQIFDRASGALVATIPLDQNAPPPAGDYRGYCIGCPQLTAAQRMLRDLGFSPPPRAAPKVTYLDPQNGWGRPLVQFPSGLVLARAADRPAAAKAFLAIDPPAGARVLDALELPDLVAYRWATSNDSGQVTVAPRPPGLRNVNP